MRVRGNVTPSPITLEPYPPKAGQVEVRLRENVREVTVVDEITGQGQTLFEYDEYSCIVKEREGLAQEIQDHLSEWRDTGRTLEVNDDASLVRDLKLALEVQTAGTD